MIRLREIDDLKLRETVREIVAEQREMSPADIPDWWELDDADFSEILIELRARESADPDDRLPK